MRSGGRVLACICLVLVLGCAASQKPGADLAMKPTPFEAEAEPDADPENLFVAVRSLVGDGVGVSEAMRRPRELLTLRAEQAVRAFRNRATGAVAPIPNRGKHAENPQSTDPQ